MRMNKDFQAI